MRRRFGDRCRLLLPGRRSNQGDQGRHRTAAHRGHIAYRRRHRPASNGPRWMKAGIEVNALLGRIGCQEQRAATRPTKCRSIIPRSQHHPGHGVRVLPGMRRKGGQNTPEQPILSGPGPRRGRPGRPRSRGTVFPAGGTAQLVSPRGESTPHDSWNGTGSDSGDLCACAALPPRGDTAHRSAIRAIVFRGEGKPLPTPLPRGAPRREWTAPVFRHRTLRGESTPHDSWNGTGSDSGDLCACAALPPRGDTAHRSAIRAIVFRGEGKPLPTPLPRGAPRREWTAPEFRHRLLDPEPRPTAVSPSEGPLAPCVSRNQRAGPARPPPPARLRPTWRRSPPAGAATHPPC